MRYHKMTWKLGQTILLALLFSITAWGQASTSLKGTVTDPGGGVIPGVTVTLTNVGTGATRTAVTDNSGLYQFPQLPPGTYNVKAEMSGFKTTVRESVQLLVNEPATLDLPMELGQVSEAVTVVGQAALINTTDASMGNAFAEMQIKQLPLEARNVVQLLSLQPGAVFLPPPANPNVEDVRNGSISGSRSDQGNVTLDGVDVNDPQFGFAYTSALRMTLDAVQEFRVTTTNYGAAQGRSSSAQVSLVTKSGTNDPHGSLYWFHRNTATSAVDYFLKRSQLESGQRPKPEFLNWHIFGGAAGGPIVKNRLFIFGNYEGFRESRQIAVLRNVPSTLFRNGYLQYRCADPAACPASTVTVGGRAIPVPAGVRALSPSELAQIDPLGIGPNQAALNYFQNFPEPNDPGRDALNIVGFRFAAPTRTKFDTWISRIDYNVDRDARHTLFWRGNLQNDAYRRDPQFPGQLPARVRLVNNKGFATGYNAVLRPNLINSFRYGYTRIGDETTGLQSRTQVSFRFIDDLSATTRNRTRFVPTHNIVDDVSWTLGRHTVQFGPNIRFTRIPRFTTDNSFHTVTTNASWLLGVGRATAPGDRRCTQPGCSAVPPVASGFLASWADSFTPLLGLITQFTARYNYDRVGNVLAEGAPVRRRYATNEYEFYLQDQWQARSNLTLTYGLRYSVYTPPWETNGLQVRPTPGFGEWFELRRIAMQQGIPSNQLPRISFDLAGPANNDRPGFFKKQKDNLAPRLSLAWSPQDFLRPLFGKGRTVFRAGYGIVYDRVGHGLATTFDELGSFGLATSLTNRSSSQTERTAPRFTGVFNVPTVDLTGQPFQLPAPPGGFPQTPRFGLFAITTGLDESIRTPYAHMFNFVIGRELPRNFMVEAAYVGRRGRRLLTRRDLAMPLDLVDPQSGMDYFTAAQMLARFREARTPVSGVPPIPYWENLFPTAGGGGLSNTQAIYNAFLDNGTDYTSALFDIDVGCSTPTCSRFGRYALFHDQFSSLVGQSTIGFSEYHALQLTVRKRFSAGTQFDFNYTLSKSLDLTSGSERRPEGFSSFGSFFSGGYTDFITNSWNPRLQYGPSDYDMRHQINMNWLAELPFGQGKRLGGGVPTWLDYIIGGWQNTGVLRWTSRLPANIINCRSCWATNWNIQGNAEVREGATLPEADTTKNAISGGRTWPNLFPQPDQARNALRFARPGEVGFRNKVRGDGYFVIDMGMAKSFRMPKEGHRLQFRWEVFNLTNSVRFNTGQLLAFPDIADTFGRYQETLSKSRIMQFGLRYDF